MAKIMEKTKEQVLQEYRKLERLEQIEREGLPLYESEEEKLMELQREYALFLRQKEVVRLISQIFEDFQRQARNGKLPTPSDIAEVIIPRLREAADADQIFIPHNPGEGIFALIIWSFLQALKLDKSGFDLVDDPLKPGGPSRYVRRVHNRYKEENND